MPAKNVEPDAAEMPKRTRCGLVRGAIVLKNLRDFADKTTVVCLRCWRFGKATFWNRVGEAWYRLRRTSRVFLLTNPEISHIKHEYDEHNAAHCDDLLKQSWREFVTQKLVNDKGKRHDQDRCGDEESSVG
jgi:hypothetical protein